ncbi:MAG: GspE/PulE family protein [Myxococcaceae bacterium]
MPSSVRFISSLALLVFAFGAIGITLELPGLAPTPSMEAVQHIVTGPSFLAPLAVAAAFYVYVRTRPLPGAMMRSAHYLPGIDLGQPTPQRLAALRANLAPRLVDADGLELADLLVHAAVQAKASDIHVHPTGEVTQLSVRVDGVLEPLGDVSLAQYGALINRLKVLGRLTHYVTDKPQDGQFALPTPDGTAEVRISLLPTQHGEKAVLRLSGLGNELPSLEALRLPDSVRNQLTRMLEKPQGLIFFTGPTGSGKTTSIYASVTHLQQTRGALAQVATIEDPIEHSIPGAAQTQVNRNAGLDFASGLRALLRQDPNVLVVGEIRDAETARIATQAALTGHLILTTVHADSAPGVFNRLLEMGVEASVLSSVSLATFSQRLLRRLCPHCRRVEPPSAEQLERLKAAGAPVEGYFTAPGCAECGQTGIAGRVAIFEVLIVGDRVREELKSAPNTQRLMSLAVEEGLVPLREAALKSARDGEVSLAEALRVTA